MAQRRRIIKKLGDEVAEKKCTKCGEDKSLDLYYNSKKSKDGRWSICKACHEKAKKAGKERRKLITNQQTPRTDETLGRCAFVRANGEQCKFSRVTGSKYCARHATRLIHDRTRTPIPFKTYDVIKKFEVIKRNKLFSLDEYPPMVQIYQDKHPDKVIIKSAQCGITEYAEKFAICALHEIPGFSIIYTFPAKDLASKFSKQRMDLTKQENQKLFTVYDKSGKAIKHYDSVFEKQVGDSYLSLTGAWASGQAISVPADMLIHDEVDFSNANVLSMFRSRIGNSDWKWRLMFSTPTYPEEGIHAQFLTTDQNHWWYQCEHCDYVFKLCCSYPDVIRLNDAGVPYFACPECHQEISRKKGWWKPENEDSQRRGYHISKLIMPRVSAAAIVDDKKEYRLEKDFWNFTLGLPYVGLEDKLSRGDIELCEDARYNLMARDEGVVLGVDQGGIDIHVIGLKMLPDKRLQLIHVDHMVGEYCWRDLNILMSQFKVARCVVDGLPDTHKAREFQRNWKGLVYLNYYQSRNRIEPIAWDAGKGHVNSHRTITLDDMCNKFRNRKYVIPLTTKTEEMKQHLMALTRQKVEKNDGNTVYEYKKVRADHYAHALNYATIAADKVQPGFFKGNYIEAKRRIISGDYSDVVVNVLARLIYFKKLVVDDIYQYRCDKQNGMFVQNMKMTDEKKLIFSRMENKYTVRDMLASVANVEAIKARMIFVEEEVLDV